MAHTIPRLTIGAFFAGLASLVGCALAQDEQATTQADAIVNGVQASDLSEAVLIDANAGFICSGAVIAPRVVLTAGHCIPDASSWTIKAPFANNQRAKSRKAWTEYVDGGDSVNPNSNDVALLILDTPITLASYPTLQAAAVPNGTKAVSVGRIKNDQASSTALFRSRQFTLEKGRPSGFPFSYVSDEVIESGDSGGPVYVGTGSARTIVAVNSGGAGGTQVLARVDLALTKIQRVVAENGGFGPGGGDGGTDGSSSSGGSSSGGTEGQCWSNTLDAWVPELGCVQSETDRVWFQCKEGQWYRGGDGENGKFEKCTSSKPLEQ